MQILKINSTQQPIQNYNFATVPSFNGKAKINKKNVKNLLEVGAAAIVGASIVKKSTSNVNYYNKRFNELYEQYSEKEVIEASNSELIEMHKNFKNYDKECEEYLAEHKSSKVGAYQFGTREMMSEIEETLISNTEYEITSFLDNEIMPENDFHGIHIHIKYTDLSKDELDKLEETISKKIELVEYINENVKETKLLVPLYNELLDEKDTIEHVKDFSNRDFNSIYKEYQENKDCGHMSDELFNYLIMNYQGEFCQKSSENNFNSNSDEYFDEFLFYDEDEDY